MGLSVDSQSFPRRPATVVLIVALLALVPAQTCAAGGAYDSVKTARFWHRWAVAVVKVTSWRRVVIHIVNDSKLDAELARTQVLAVLATERLVPTDLKIYVERFFPSLAGPIKPGGIFLVSMVRYKKRWIVPCDEGAIFIPRGLDSVAVTGLSDHLVKKIEAKIEKLIVLAHARK